MHAYEIIAGSSSLDGLRRCERPDPEPLPTQILVRMQAASLNYRDLLVPRGHYMGGPVGANSWQGGHPLLSLAITLQCRLNRPPRGSTPHRSRSADL